MGYYDIERCEVRRVYTAERHLLARTYCPETKKWTEQKFLFDDLAGAFAWCTAQMQSKSM